MSNEVMEVVDKTPIEIALGIDENGYTTAKMLYSFLELDPGNYSRWCKLNIVENHFATAGEDYKINSSSKKSLTGRGNTIDYKLSANFAKKLSMQSNTEKGEKARDYFVGCEQVLKRLAEQKQRTLIEREKGIVIRQALTKALQQSGENERMHKHAYSNYTDHIVYKQVFGMKASELRDKYGITKKDNLRDCFSEEELRKVQSAEMLVSSLIEYGWGFDEIKDFVMNKANKMIE